MQPSRPRHRRILPAVALSVLATLLVTGCGDDDGTSGSSDGDAAAADIEVTATEFAFSPNAWSATAGEPFTVGFTNDGTTNHEWAVITLGDDLASEDDFTEEKVLLEVEAIDEGTSTVEEFTIDEPGTYQVICGLPGHFDEGMEGTLTID